MAEQSKPFAQMSRRDLIAEIKRLRREPENEMTIAMLVSAGFVSALKVSQARKIARDVIAKSKTE